MKTKLLLILIVLFSLQAKAQQQAAFLNALEAINITTNSVTFKYNVRTNGSYTNCSVWYSLSSNWANPVIGITPSAGFPQNLSWQSGSANVGGLQPNTTYYWRVVASNNSGNADSETLSFTTLSIPTAPTITAISASGGVGSAVISYTLNANSAATTSIVKYGLTSGSLTSQVAGSSATGTVPTSQPIVISGLLPSTQYFYQIEATNSITTTTSTIENFITTIAGDPVAEYNFDNTYNNINGNAPFISNTGTSFTTDRHLNTTGAVNIINTGSSALIPDLPYASSPRTISLWVKFNVLQSGFNFIYHYGTAATGNGMFLNPNTITHFVLSPSNHSVSTTTVINTWYHLVMMYDGSNSKTYINGALIDSAVRTINTGVGTGASLNLFRLGLTEQGTAGYFNGAIDDLKIYNYAITDTQVLNLFTNNSLLSSQNFNQNNLQVALYPNPATDILNIEMTSEVKSVEIYSLQGQKVMTSTQKQINVSSLSKGMYLIKVTDAENNSSSQKLIVK